jgi:hypothetical protein
MLLLSSHSLTGKGVESKRGTDREQVIDMLTKVEDKFALSIYKKVYNISDEEIANKRRTLREKGHGK